MAPVLCRGILKPLALPVDDGKRFFGRPLFGSHKTWRGIIVAIIAGGIVFAMQRWLYAEGVLRSLALFDYGAMPAFLGFLVGSGAILGDLVKSFLKRRVGIRPGKPWYIVDQLDYVAGAILLCAPFFFPGWQRTFVLAGVSIVLAILVNHAAFWLRIRSEKW